MPLAVTHVLLTIILVGLYRDYVTKHKKYFTLHTVFIAGVAGLLPDIDVPLRMVSEFFSFGLSRLFQHGGITHTLLFASVFLIPGFVLWNQKKHKMAVYFFVISFGITFHIFLDFLLGGGAHYGIMFFYPFSTVGYKVHILNRLGLSSVPMALDAIILLAWLWHEEYKHKISDFI